SGEGADPNRRRRTLVVQARGRDSTRACDREPGLCRGSFEQLLSVHRNDHPRRGACPAGGEVTIHYDPMIAKVIAHGETRPDAIQKLDAALADYVLDGVTTNIPFL